MRVQSALGEAIPCLLVYSNSSRERCSLQRAVRAFFLLMIAALLLVSARARAGDLGDVKRRGELVWGGDLQGGEPFVYEDEKTPGKIKGFEVEIA